MLKAADKNFNLSKGLIKSDVEFEVPQNEVRGAEWQRKKRLISFNRFKKQREIRATILDPAHRSCGQTKLQNGVKIINKLQPISVGI